MEKPLKLCPPLSQPGIFLLGTQCQENNIKTKDIRNPDKKERYHEKEVF
jgi:hypothetical protein